MTLFWYCNLLQAEYEVPYVNYCALTGTLDRGMSSYRRADGGFRFNIRVYPHGEQIGQL